MSTMTSLAQALAVERGVAQPVATVRHAHISHRPMGFVPLAMAGEAGAPLAAMAGEAGSPRLLVVPEPRNLDQRFAFAAELATVIVPYIEGFLTEREVVAGARGREDRLRCTDAPQILVPNLAGIGFVRLLGRSTRFRRADGQFAVAPGVPVLGRWLSYLAGRAENPASCLLLAATDALSRHWASGQSAAEDLNLAALAGWIDPPPGATGFEAAAAAENPLAWPPAGPATDPTFDNEVLAPLMTAYERVGDSQSARHRARAALEDALAGQLEPTWRLLWRAAGLLRELPEGGHVAERWDADKDAVTGYADYLAEGGAPQPRRDSAVTAARRLSWLERAQASYVGQCAYDDPLVMASARLAGEAFAGTVTAAQPTRVDNAGRRRRLRPLITVATADPVRIEPGTALASPARPSQNATMLSVSGDGGLAEVTLELAGGMGRSLTPEPGSVPEQGERVCYTTLTGAFQPLAEFPPVEETPWTHGGPPVPYQPTDEDAAEEWS
jgi:hypothetical protein